MKVLVVSRNGKRICAAGLKDGALSADLTWLFGVPDFDRDVLMFRVHGTDCQSNEHVEWKMPRLKVGDSITIDIVEADRADPGTKRRPATDLERVKKEQRPRRKRRAKR